MVDAGWDPHGLLRWQQVTRRFRLHIGNAFEGVHQLVEIVRVPAGHDFVAQAHRVRAGTGARSRRCPRAEYLLRG